MTTNYRLTPATDEMLRFNDAVAEKIKPDPKSIVLILDNLKDLIDGDVNTQRDVSQVFEALKLLRRRVNRAGMSFTTIIVHHSGKDVGRGMLGSSMLGAVSATRAFVRNGTFTMEKNRFGEKKVSFGFAIATDAKGVGYAVPAAAKNLRGTPSPAPAVPAAKPAPTTTGFRPAPASVDPKAIVRRSSSKKEAERAYYESAFGGDPELPAFDSVPYRKEPRMEEARNRINSAVRALKKQRLIEVGADGKIRHL